MVFKAIIKGIRGTTPNGAPYNKMPIGYVFNGGVVIYQTPYLFINMLRKTGIKTTVVNPNYLLSGILL